MLSLLDCFCNSNNVLTIDRSFFYIFLISFFFFFVCGAQNLFKLQINYILIDYNYPPNFISSPPIIQFIYSPPCIVKFNNGIDNHTFSSSSNLSHIIWSFTRCPNPIWGLIIIDILFYFFCLLGIS